MLMKISLCSLLSFSFWIFQEDTVRFCWKKEQTSIEILNTFQLVSKQTHHVLHWHNSPFWENVTISFTVGKWTIPSNSWSTSFFFSTIAPSSAVKQYRTPSSLTQYKYLPYSSLLLSIAHMDRHAPPDKLSIFSICLECVQQLSTDTHYKCLIQPRDYEEILRILHHRQDLHNLCHTPSFSLPKYPRNSEPREQAPPLASSLS